MIKFLQKVVAWAKNANIFSNCFGENILKIIKSVPDWANFRHLAIVFFAQFFFKLTQVAQKFWLPFFLR
jgi:hypothetical protein